MHTFYTLDDVNVQGKRVLVRLDLNMPLKDGELIDDTRLQKSLPTLRELLDHGARLVLCAHFGRPKGVAMPELSLKHLHSFIEKALNQKVHFALDLKNQPNEQPRITLLENLRFDPGEESNDAGFAKMLAAWGDVYVNDAFSVSHRSHASVDAITKHLPNYAGRLFEKEIKALKKATNSPPKPIMAVVGGSKVSTKLHLLKSLAKRVDYLVPAGALANTFLFAHRKSVGRSLHEPDMVDTVSEIESIARTSGCAIIVPSDVVVTEKIVINGKHRVCDPLEVHYNEMIVDFGPKSVRDIYRIAQLCRTFVWNGPLGVFETPPFDQGSLNLARKMAELTQEKGLYTLAGGGETGAVLAQSGVADQFSYVSGAGGAFLEYLEGKKLPGLMALHKK